MAKVPDFGGETRGSIPAPTLVNDHTLPVDKLVALQALNMTFAIVNASGVAWLTNKSWKVECPSG